MVAEHDRADSLKEIFGLENRVAMITGASRGLGAALADGLAKVGADLILVARDRARLAEVAAVVKTRGRQALIVQADVTRREDVERVVAEAMAEMGRVDILVNNAGMSSNVPVLDLTDDEWNSVLETNLRGCFLCCQAVGREMVRRGGGSVINITSIRAARAGIARGAYAASKAGITQLTRVLGAGVGATRHHRQRRRAGLLPNRDGHSPPGRCRAVGRLRANAHSAGASG